jgi:hypothetical protein
MNFMQIAGRFARAPTIRIGVMLSSVALAREVRAMRLAIEIIAAVLFVCCITATSAAFAADKIGHSADGLSFSASANAAPHAL